MKRRGVAKLICIVPLAHAIPLSAKPTYFRRRRWRILSWLTLSFRLSPARLGFRLLRGGFRAGRFLYSHFSGSSSSGGYSSSTYYRDRNCLPTISKPQIIHETIEIRIDDPIPRKVLLLKPETSDMIEENMIRLENGGYLSVEKDGRMIFSDVGFEASMYLHYNDSLSFYNEKDDLIMIVQKTDDTLYFLQQQESDCSGIISLIFGDMK